MLPERLVQIEAMFRRGTGLDLAALARKGALGQSNLRPPAERAVFPSFVDVRVAVVPISAGKGFIPGFCEAVASVCSFLGCESFVTQKPDVAGLAAAAERHAHLVLLADDERFVCLDLRSGRLTDNGAATGRGYAAALAAAAEGSAEPGQKRVLVVGLGAVGRAAAQWLVEAGFEVLGFDSDSEAAAKAALDLPLAIPASIDAGLETAGLVLDASPARDFLDAPRISGQMVVAAPGMPSGVTAAAAELLGDRFLHEPLALGVATMVCLALEGERQR
jgi:pyrrolysine biosynthesis protein PylD